MRFENPCNLFLFTFYTTSSLFWNEGCTNLKITGCPKTGMSLALCETDRHMGNMQTPRGSQGADRSFFHHMYHSRVTDW